MESSKDNKFSICVVIPAYNIAEFIGRAIDSVLAQTHKPDEIIVVDDGSGDNTAEVIKSYGTKVRYIYQENAGLSAARNTGIKAAGSEWIAFLDGDDEWFQDHLLLQLNLLKRNPELMWSAANCMSCLCGENRRAPNIEPAKAKALLGTKEYFEDYFQAFQHHAAGNSDTMIIKRQTLHQAGLFRETMRCAQDIDMWFRIAMFSPKFGYVTQPTAVYHLNRTEATSLKTKTKDKLLTACGLIQRSIDLAKKQNRYHEFKPCVKSYLRRLIRSWLFSYALAGDIRAVLVKFDEQLSLPYKTSIRLLTIFPKATAFCLHMISRIVRALNLRKTIMRRPRRS